MPALRLYGRTWHTASDMVCFVALGAILLIVFGHVSGSALGTPGDMRRSYRGSMQFESLLVIATFITIYISLGLNSR
jgi:hypothetical protein